MSKNAIDIVSIGSALQDVFVNVPPDADSSFVRSGHLLLSLGAKINVDYPLFEVGGGATNTAVNFSIQGLKTALMSRIANDRSGQLILGRLRKFGINTEFLQIDNDGNTGMSVILNVPGQDRTVLVSRGVSHQLNFDEINWQRVEQAKWLYVCAFGSPGSDDFDKLTDFVKSHKIEVAFNPGINQIKKDPKQLCRLIEHTSILVMNKSEAAALTKSSKTERVTVILDKLKDLGPKHAIITHGSSGVFAADHKGNRYFTSPVQVETVCTLGAGDAFASTYTASIIQSGWDVPLALKRATINSAFVVQNAGAQIGLETHQVLDTFMSEYNLQVEDLSSQNKASLIK
jgi:ribokinase